PAVVFDDETGAGGDVRFEVGVDAARVAGDHLHVGVVEAPCQRPAFDEKIHVEARPKNVVKGTNDELVLTKRDDAHGSRASPPSATAGCPCRKLSLYAHA